MNSTIAEKVAWVTGGSAGIGLGIAHTLVEMNYRVVLSGRDQGTLLSARSALEAAGGKIDIVQADASVREQVNAAARAIEERHGRLDLLVNNAGFNVRAREWSELIPEEFDAVIATNLTGTFNAIYAVLPLMRRQKSGTIVNISSTAGKQVSLGAGVAYTAAKHGVQVMSKLLNDSELKNGIRTCVVAPAGVDTRAHAWRPQEMRDKMLSIDDVARAVRFAVETSEKVAIFEIDVRPAV